MTTYIFPSIGNRRKKFSFYADSKIPKRTGERFISEPLIKIGSELISSTGTTGFQLMRVREQKSDNTFLVNSEDGFDEFEMQDIGEIIFK